MHAAPCTLQNGSECAKTLPRQAWQAQKYVSPSMLFEDKGTLLFEDGGTEMQAHTNANHQASL